LTAGKEFLRIFSDKLISEKQLWIVFAGQLIHSHKASSRTLSVGCTTHPTHTP
jgi:hypothetical protein